MLILVRHGRTALNAAGLLQGRTDAPLDDVGVEQAAAVAARVGDLDELICSPLPRARQTAEAFRRPFEIDERWIELDYGVYEGTPFGSMPSEVWDRWRSDPTFEPEGGESLAALDARVRSACDELMDRAAVRNIGVVTHVSPIKAAVAWALDTGVGIAWRCHLAPASICRIDIRANGPMLTAFNEVAD